jgi:hypothetical protein
VVTSGFDAPPFVVVESVAPPLSVHAINAEENIAMQRIRMMDLIRMDVFIFPP